MGWEGARQPLRRRRRPAPDHAGRGGEAAQREVETTEQLLTKGAKTKDRKALAKSSGLKGPELLDLARRCDLLRIKGVGSEMVLLLEAAGVKSTAELASKEAAALTAATESANKKSKISEKPPTEPQLSDWIGQAKKLPQVVEKK